MSNAESGEGKSQESLPDLYKLLGLSPLEADVNKIQRALLALQKKADAAQSDAALTQRIVRVVALGKKNLLDAQRKIAYDRAWTKAFGSGSREDTSAAMAVPAAQEKSAGQPVAKPASKSAERPVVTNAVTGTVGQAVADGADQTTSDLEWDLNELESYLPPKIRELRLI